MKNIFYILLFTTTFLYSQCTEGEVELWEECYSLASTTLDLEDEGLEGEIPLEIGEIFDNATFLDLDSNKVDLSKSNGKFRFISYIF